MMRELPASVVPVGQALAANAGGYLRNVLRISGVTCSACGTPTGGYATCYPCKQQRDSGLPLADRVTSMVYAVKPSASMRDQMYTAMFGYKAATPQLTHTNVVRSLLALAILGHVDCDLRLAGMSHFRWTTVAGTQHVGEHPLHRLIAGEPGTVLSPLFVSGYELETKLRAGATKQRDIRPENVEVVGGIAPDTHVAVYDDSWVTGGSAQSVAVALKQAGARSVSILTVARVLGPEYSPNAEFLRSEHARRDFDYRVCPWTGADCP
ncbi:hypothetical protein ATJ88_2042 [Isoptericola jiangsuensis]|uniref:Rhodanese domain-containing protein n=2 Tax=Isoptericola jiangsuensis TaxID=548579 RepID=A0A2A9EXS0_9MICO|nr:hypothetical protein ATJ88_2042 [Isoptericola jiangsuensis]